MCADTPSRAGRRWEWMVLAVPQVDDVGQCGYQIDNIPRMDLCESPSQPQIVLLPQRQHAVCASGDGEGWGDHW